MEKLGHLENGGEDIVYPLHIQDTCTGNMMLLAWSMRFNDVLDADRLQASLTRLLEIEDWRKLGGRMRKVESAKKQKPTRWEVHAPAVYTEDRPAISFSHDTHAIGIDDHPQAKDFAKPSENVSVFNINRGVRDLMTPDGFPNDFDQWLAQDWPQVTLKVSTFNDATMVTLIWPHYLLDASAHECLMRNWVRVLAGNEKAVDRVLGAHEDVLERVEESEEKDSEPLYLEKHQMTVWQKIMYMVPFLWSLICRTPADLRMVYVPKYVFARLKERTVAEAREAAEQLGIQDSFVSDGDVLTAWFAKTSRIQSNQNMPVNLTQIVDVRARVNVSRNAPGVFLQNMIILAFAFLSVEQLAGTVGSVALLHRQAMVKALAESQVLAYLRDIRHRLHNNKPLQMILGDPKGRPIIVNNTARAKMMPLVDFSPAVIAQGEDDEARKNPLGTMVCYFNVRMHGEHWILPGSFYYWGQDHGQGYWLTQSLRPKEWEIMNEELAKLNNM